MFAKVLNLSRKPAPTSPINNILHIERVRRQHYFNAIERAILASNLTRNNIERVMCHARDIWRKHLDAVPGYTHQRDCEREALDYLDSRVRFQRTDQAKAPIRPWSPGAA